MNNNIYPEQSNRRFGPVERRLGAVPNADMISVETIVNMLVKKNICTAEELFMLEGTIKEQNHDNNQNSFVSIKYDAHQSNQTRLKRLMSKRRWTRRLGTALFGWKWKKVKKSPSY